MTRHHIHDHHQNLAYHFPKNSRGSTPAPVRASSLSDEGCLRQVFVLLFCAVRSSVCLARPLLMLDLSRTDTWGTSRCSYERAFLIVERLGLHLSRFSSAGCSPRSGCAPPFLVGGSPLVPLVSLSPSCRVHTSDSHELQSCAATFRMEMST